MKCTECSNELTDDELYYLENICNECEMQHGNRHDNLDSEFIKIFGKISAVILILFVLAITV